MIPLSGPISGVSNPVNATQGNLIVVGYIGTPSQTIASITDNKNNHYANSGVHGTSSDGGECYYWYAANATAGVTSITFNVGISAADSAEIYDVSGAAASPLDLTTTINNQHSSTNANISGPTITPTATGELVVAEIGVESNALSAVATPFTFDPQDQNNGWAHVVNNTVQSYTPSWSINQNEAGAGPGVGFWGGAAAAFKAAGNAPPLSPCDVNGDGTTNVADVQLEVNMALGISPCTNPSGTCTVVSVQRVVNAALGGQCVSP
jgi:hypothetical protein